MSATVAISSITIGNRHRGDMGDLRALANSIAEVGLLQPIGVTSRGELCSASAASVLSRPAGLDRDPRPYREPPVHRGWRASRGIRSAKISRRASASRLSGRSMPNWSDIRGRGRT